jgi:phytoene desaturase
MRRKKIAVIGSGIGGSGVAAMLAKAGYDVDLYEKTKLIGGRYASYSPKKGYHLDLGVHITTASHLGKMAEILKVLGQPDAVKWKIFDLECNYKGESLKYPDEMYKFGLTAEDLMQVQKFYQETLSIPDDQIEEYNKISLREQIAKYIKSERAQTIFAFWAAILVCIPADVVAVGEWAIAERDVAAKGERGTGHPLGGTGVIPEAYVRIMEKNGGKLHLGTTIKRIVVKDKVATGIELADGTIKDYDIVISNAGNKLDLDLVGRENYSQPYVEKTEKYQYAGSGLCMRFALDQPVLPTDKDAIFYLGSDELWTVNAAGPVAQIPDTLPALMIVILSNIDEDVCPAGKQMIAVGSIVPETLDTPDERWKQWEKSCLNTLDKLWPGTAKHVEWSSYTTPADYNKMFGEDGCVIGIGQSIGQVGKKRPPIQDPEIKNLYHCSADSGMYAVGGDLAADSALRLFKMLTG